MVPRLHDAGLLTYVDRAGLAMYCQAWGRWVEAEEQVKKHGAVVKTAKGNLIQNPYLAIANRAMKQLQSLASDFGMTPSSRSRVTVQAQAEEQSLAEQLFEMVDRG